MDDFRIWRSPYTVFHAREPLSVAGVYTPQVLRGIADAGFNAIWVRGILRDMLPSSVFPEFGRQSPDHLRSMRTVIRRGGKAGVRVVLYMQAPFGFPEDHAFWRRHPELRGTTYDFDGSRASAPCLSTAPVREYLREAAERLSRALPELAAVILITASEYVQHCYSHHRPSSEGGECCGMKLVSACPRCASLRPQDLVGDIIRLTHEGFAAAGNGLPLIAWNWSWSFYEPDPQEGILRILPSDVTLLAGFERGGKKKVLGKERVIDEYSLGYAGPSPRFVDSLRAARRRGLRVMAKLQFGTTHELATVPNLPLVGVLYDKAKALRRLRVRGFMGCWNFGNMLTANTAAFLQFMDMKRLPPKPKALRDFAAAYFPGCDAAAVTRAWERFESAMGSYPFSIPFLYYGPLNYALSMPIEPGPSSDKPVGPSWQHVARGDDLADTLGPFTVDEVIEGLGRLTRGWAKGVEELERGLAGCDAPTAGEELRAAKVIGHCFHSGWNLYRAWRLRKDWKPEHIEPLRAIMRDERAHLAEAIPIVASDRRMGFHPECQRYQFTATALRRKRRRLDEMVE